MIGVGSVTVTLQVALNEPSTVVTVIVELPAFNAVTLPFVTEATLGFEETQVTFLFVAFVGFTVAVNVCELPTSSDKLDLFKLTPVTSIVVGC